MKFRDKYGNVFDDIETARRQICIENTCRKCVVAKENNGHYVSCFELMQRRPMEAACLMGYEVIKEPGIDLPLPEYDTKRIEHKVLENELKTLKDVMKANKPLKDWTLGEIKEFCTNSDDDCRGCPLLKKYRRRDDEECPFLDVLPHEWDLEETEETDELFFQNKDCKYFPCHKIVDERNFNCMFCYCPLYHMEKCGGNYSYTADGIKDCSKCTYPHERKNCQEIVKLIKKGGK